MCSRIRYLFLFLFYMFLVVGRRFHSSVRRAFGWKCIRWRIILSTFVHSVLDSSFTAECLKLNLLAFFFLPFLLCHPTISWIFMNTTRVWYIYIYVEYRERDDEENRYELSHPRIFLFLHTNDGRVAWFVCFRTMPESTSWPNRKVKGRWQMEKDRRRRRRRCLWIEHNSSIKHLTAYLRVIRWIQNWLLNIAWKIEWKIYKTAFEGGVGWNMRYNSIRFVLPRQENIESFVCACALKDERSFKHCLTYFSGNTDRS